MYGGLLFNYPDPDDAGLPALNPSDIVVLTTRPPLNDHDGWDRKSIQKSGSSLEQAILGGVGRYFDGCRRSYIRLNHETAAHLGPAADRAEMHFHVYKRSHYRRHRNPYGNAAARHFVTRPAANTTAAFLVSVPLTPGGAQSATVLDLTRLLWPSGNEREPGGREPSAQRLGDGRRTDTLNS